MTEDLRITAANLLVSNDTIAQKNAALGALADRAHRVVDDVSHEFRTPLAVIKEFTSIITDGLAGPITEDQANYLKIIDGPVLGLNQMVEDLLDSSKLRAGCLKVSRKRHDVRAVLAEDRVTLARRASTRSIIIEEEIDSDLPPVFADSEKMRRVISNLMTNAIKFSSEGGTIRLTAKRSSTPGLVSIAIIDQGPGLSPDDVDRLFGRFKQASTSRDVSAKGFGLGLSIAKELAWLNLGCLSVESVKGQGSTFSFTVPEYDRAAILVQLRSILEESACSQDKIAILHAQELIVDSTDHAQRGFEIQEFLASVTQPTDIVIPLQFHATSSQPSGCWVIGRTTDPQAWLKRLRGAHKGLSQNNSLKLTSLTLEVEQVWDYPDETDQAFEGIAALTAQEFDRAA